MGVLPPAAALAVVELLVVSRVDIDVDVIITSVWHMTQSR
jgi:hypothetical protein